MKYQENESGEVNILIVDDDRKLCLLVSDYLEHMGYDVKMAHTGAQGLRMALEGDCHALILDVMMPDMDGFEMLRRLREKSDVPVLMLTARGEETDRIVGLEMGADDYLPKTFSTRELLARLRAVLRRSSISERQAASQNALLEFDDLRINQGSREARLGDKILKLTPIEFDLLTSLAKSSGRALSREKLLDSVADRNYDVFDRSVDVHISSLRRKLGDNPRASRFIHTIRGAGYMFKIMSER